MKPKVADKIIIETRRAAAEMERRRKGFVRQFQFDRTWANYHPVHRVNAAASRG